MGKPSERSAPPSVKGLRPNQTRRAAVVRTFVPPRVAARSAQPNSVLRRKPRTPYQIDHVVRAAVNGTPVSTLTATITSTSPWARASTRTALRSSR